MRVTIDRFDGSFAVVEKEDKTFANLPKALVPQGAGEGSVLSIELDGQETKRRRAETAALIEQLWKD